VVHHHPAVPDAGLAATSSNLIADIFAPVSLLCLILIFSGRGISHRERIILYILFFLAHCMHLSHLPVNLIFLALLILARQLTQFRAGDGNGAFLEGTLLYERIRKYIPGELQRYIHSRQNRQGALMPGLRGFNLLSSIFMGISTAVLLLFSIWQGFRRKIPAGDRWLGAMLIAALIIHTAVNASLGTVIDRYGAKIMWFIPLLATLCILKIFISSTAQPQTSHSNA
jgi:hypothetical protein